MHSFLLLLHSWLRWPALLLLLYALYRAYAGLAGRKGFTPADRQALLWALTALHVQFVIGLALYLISPWVKPFLMDMAGAMKDKVARYWGLEHILGNLLAVIVITIAYSRAKRATLDSAKFRIAAIGFSLGLLILLVNIPWPFREAIGRPWFRF